MGGPRAQKKLPGDPGIISRRSDLLEPGILGFMSAQTPVESLSSLGSNSAYLISISFSSSGGFTKFVSSSF